MATVMTLEELEALVLKQVEEKITTQAKEYSAGSANRFSTQKQNATCTGTSQMQYRQRHTTDTPHPVKQVDRSVHSSRQRRRNMDDIASMGKANLHHAQKPTLSLPDGRKGRMALPRQNGRGPRVQPVRCDPRVRVNVPTRGVNEVRGKPRVFMAHPVRVPPKKEGMASPWKFDIRPIAEYGELLWFFESSEMMSSPVLAREEIVKLYHQHGFDPREDYLLAAGDMTMYGLMLSVSIGQFGMTPKVLRHNRDYDRYDVLPAMDYYNE